MKLRIVSGSFGGRVITLGKSAADCRPTQERQRESVSQILRWRIEGARVADVCAGSGAIGFEFLSRGAAWVDFVEIHRERAEAIEKHAGLFGVQERCRVWRDDVRRFLKNARGGYDIVYFDPPYEDAALAQAAVELRALLADNGVLVYERLIRPPFAPPAFPGAPACIDHREFGMTAVDFYSNRPLNRAAVDTSGCSHEQAGGQHGDSTLSGDL